MFDNHYCKWLMTNITITDAMKKNGCPFCEEKCDQQ